MLYTQPITVKRIYHQRVLTKYIRRRFITLQRMFKELIREGSHMIDSVQWHISD